MRGILNVDIKPEIKRFFCRSRTTKLSDELEDIINEVGGTIYGGYVRDMVIIQKNAASFFSQAQDKLDMYNTVDLYRKQSFMPQFAKRLIEHASIDCILSSEQFNSFKSLINQSRLSMIKCHGKQSQEIFDVPVMQKSYFIKYDVHELVENIAPWNVRINIAVYDQLLSKVTPLPVSCDLECNSLILFNNLVILNNNIYKELSILKKVEKLRNIIDDIEKGETRVLSGDLSICTSSCAQNICMLRDFTIKSAKHEMKYQKEAGHFCDICKESTQYTFSVNSRDQGHVHTNCFTNR